MRLKLYCINLLSNLKYGSNSVINISQYYYSINISTLLRSVAPGKCPGQIQSGDVTDKWIHGMHLTPAVHRWVPHSLDE